MILGIISDLDRFDPDEVFLLLVSTALTLYGVYYWWRYLRPISKLGVPRLRRLPLYVAVLLGLAFIHWVIRDWADPEIRKNSGYMLLVYMMGGGYLTVVGIILPWLGVSVREDAFERGNAGAVGLLSGLALGVLITYGGSNVGEGPSFWNNVFTATLTTGSLLASWVVLAVAGGASTSIMEDRDEAAGLRVGCLLLAEALILGRAAAGNWESAYATTVDLLRDGWLGGFLCAAAVMMERTMRATPRTPRPPLVTHGLAPGLIYLLVAAVWLAHLGWWEGAPR